MMGKRSDFQRRPHDEYDTPYAGVPALIPWLNGIRTYIEPCIGRGMLRDHLAHHGLVCVRSYDIRFGVDALEVDDFGPADAIITNPPWSRPTLHRMILHFQRHAQTWLLFDGDWAHTKQAAPFLDQCSHIVSVGRLKWIEGSPHTGKDNCAWYRFDKDHTGGPLFVGQRAEAA